MLKKYRPYILVFYALAAVALVVAAFVDLKLDIALNNPQSIFARWFEATGEMPGKLLPTIAGTVIFYAAGNKALKAFGLLANITGSVYMSVYHIQKYLFREDLPLAVGIVYGIGVAAIALFIGQYIKIPEKLKKPLCVLAVTGIIVMFVEIGAIEAVKVLWGRVRFRDLLKAGSYAAFTPWYHPNGINGNQSFPSGHTGNAALSYLMLLLPFVSEKWEKHRVWCFVIPFVFTSVLAYTRLVMGAHYLSDVTMGGTIGFSCVLIALWIVEKKFLPNEQEAEQCKND